MTGGGFEGRTTVPIWCGLGVCHRGTSGGTQRDRVSHKEVEAMLGWIMVYVVLGAVIAGAIGF